jgi:hypothetical protein
MVPATKATLFFFSNVCSGYKSSAGIVTFDFSHSDFNFFSTKIDVLFPWNLMVNLIKKNNLKKKKQM